MISILYREPTPNPEAFKFVADSILVKGGALSYESPAEAADSPVAAPLFALPGIRAVYIMENFVSINAGEEADWEAIEESIRDTIDDFAPMDLTPDALTRPSAAETDDPEMLEKVNTVIDEMVRPALAGDGGGLEVVGLKEYLVTVRYQGACGGCPSAFSNTLYAIENLLKSEIDSRLSLVTA